MDNKRELTVLVIDDEPLVAGFIAEALQAEGSRVVIAGGGEEGLGFLENAHFDAVFLDLVMPDMDGLEVLRRVRQLHRDLPVVIVSGWATRERVQQAFELGATGVVEKPLALKHLTEAVVRLREHARGR